MARDEDDFLSRWSRRKVEARQGLRRKEEAPARRNAGEPEARQSIDATPEGQTGSPRQPQGEQAELTAPEERTAPEAEAEQEGAVDPSEFDDVDFDKLDYHSDYTRFMRKGVPEQIRRRALRALWQSDPILANVDGLNDYDDDFTDAALAVKELVTSWKARGGYLTDEERQASYGDADEREAKEEETAAAESPQTDGPGGEDDHGEAQEPRLTEAGAELEETGTDPSASGQPDDDKA